jgi:hypothetical protein
MKNSIFYRRLDKIKLNFFILKKELKNEIHILQRDLLDFNDYR